MCTRKRGVGWIDLENEDSSDLKVANKKVAKKAPEKTSEKSARKKPGKY